MNTLHHYVNFMSHYVAARQVDVWRPPGYETETAVSYPVLYMHDGQNLFDPATAYSGVTWGIAAAMTRLIAAGQIPPTLVVGIWNNGPNRWREYLPQRPLLHSFIPADEPDFSRIQAQSAAKLGINLPEEMTADNYLRFLVTELKPFIDATYRTTAHTYIMGSSMGGLISLYALCEYPDVFAGAGCVSTHWPAVSGVILPYLRQYLPPPGQHKLYFDYGTGNMDSEYEPYQQAVDDLLRQMGYTADHALTRCFPGADHNEASWQARVHIPLQFLLG